MAETVQKDADMTELDEGSDKIISSVSPANLQSDAGMLKELLRLYSIKLETVKPAVVRSVDRAGGTVDVQPLVDDVYATESGIKYHESDIIAGIPFLRLQHGMFWVDAPIYPGDTGYVVAGHRDGTLAIEANGGAVLEPKRDSEGNDISARTNNQGPQPPNTYLTHRYENGFFIPCRWGTIQVSEADKDSLIIARLKENEVKSALTPPIYETLGVEGKVTLEKDGTARIVNGTGLVIDSDEVRTETETVDGVETEIEYQKPSVYIDPTADLTTTDARFRVVEMPTTGSYVDDDGKIHVPTKRVRVLADEGAEKGNELIISGKDGGSAAGMVDDVYISTESNVENTPLYVEKVWSGRTIKFKLTLGDEEDSEDPREEGGEDYCNLISDEIDGGVEDEEIDSDNSITHDDNMKLDSGSGTVKSDGNAVSYTPCQ